VKAGGLRMKKSAWLIASKLGKATLPGGENIAANGVWRREREAG
jgi:hypothetical protein